jgi:hypothetical protein
MLHRNIYYFCRSDGGSRDALVGLDTRSGAAGHVFDVGRRESGVRVGYTFSAPINLGRLLAGTVSANMVASPTGVVPEWTKPVPGEVPAGSGTGQAA